MSLSTEPDGRPRAPRAAADLLTAMVGQLGSHGQERPGQREMTRLAAEALGAGSCVAIRAGTGTGKSLAVLATLAAMVGDGHRAVLATATKALQDQYVGKELAILQRALAATGAPALEWAVLKGRANYACRLRLEELEATAGAPGHDGPASQLVLEELGPGSGSSVEPPRSAHDHDRAAQVLLWASATRTGELSELPFELDHRLAPWLSTGSEGCPGAARCPHGETCWAERAIRSARDADLVVVNLALFGADLALDGALMGEADVVALDEAHDAEDVLAAAFGASLDVAELDRLAGRVRAVGRPTATEAREEGDAGTAADRLRRSLRRTSDRLGALLVARAGQRLPGGVAQDPALHAALVGLAGHLAEVQRLTRTAGEDAGGRVPLAVEVCRREADRLAEVTGRLLAEGSQDAVWVEERTSTLRRLPVDLGDRLARAAWGGRAVLLCSASLGTSTAARLGLPDAPLHDVGSPFEHREAALLYVPELLAELPGRLRNPSHAGWFDAAWSEAATVIDAAQGRTLFLCTSVRNARRFAERAREELAWPVLVQGERPKSALLGEFASDEHSVLFGTMGLWQGVDVAGPSLSCVVVDRLPFPRPDDPLWQARTELAASRFVDAGGSPRDAGYQAFLEVSVPRAATLLAQGTGRLIRTERDRGVVVVLDPRLAEKPYRRLILDELPPMRRTRARHEAVAHLRAVTGTA